MNQRRIQTQIRGGQRLYQGGKRLYQGGQVIFEGGLVPPLAPPWIRHWCEHLQDMSDELASTAKGYHKLLLNAEKLILELNSEKIKSFQLETDKSSVEQTVLELQASSEILGQRKQQLEEELEQVRDRMTQLEADLSALKKSKVEYIVLDDGERMSERSDEIALFFKIKLLEEEINELREVLPKASERGPAGSTAEEGNFRLGSDAERQGGPV